MRVPNPFAARTLTLIESRPRLPADLAGLRAISIGPDPDDPAARPSLDRIDALLADLPAPEEVELLEIDYDSRLTGLPNLEPFPNLRYAHVAGTRIRSHAPLHPLRRIRSLFLVSYREGDLSRFTSRRLDYLRLIRGRVSRVDLDARSALLQRCSGLTRLDDSRIESLIVEGCHRLDLETLPGVAGLVSLRLVAQRDIPSLGWLRECRSLRSLAITTDALKRTDVAALRGIDHLEAAFFSLPEPRLRQIAAQNPGLIVTNGEVCLRDQRRLDVQEYHRAVERLSPPIRE